MENAAVVTPSHRAYIEDGILYNEYVGELSLEAILDVEKQAVELIAQNKIHTIPEIVVLKNIDTSNFKLHVGDYGKAISGFDLIKHLSGVWMIGATGEIRKIAEVISKVFFLNRIRFVDTLKEAQDAAHKSITAVDSILEKEDK